LEEQIILAASPLSFIRAAAENTIAPKSNHIVLTSAWGLQSSPILALLLFSGACHAYPAWLEPSGRLIGIYVSVPIIW